MSISELIKYVGMLSVTFVLNILALVFVLGIYTAYLIYKNNSKDDPTN